MCVREAFLCEEVASSGGGAVVEGVGSAWVWRWRRGRTRGTAGPLLGWKCLGRRGEHGCAGGREWVDGRAGGAWPCQLDLFNLKTGGKQQGGRVTKHVGVIKSTERETALNG